MKKVLITGVALMLAGGAVAPVFAADATPGFVMTGDARARVYWQSDDYFPAGVNPAGAAFGNANQGRSSQTNFDSRVRFNFLGTAAGGSYVAARVRMGENKAGAMDQDIGQINDLNQNNIWVDKAYFGIPFSSDITVEIGKYRSTYGPLPLTYNFFYDDVQLNGARGIVKIGKDIEINPFLEVMEDSQQTALATSQNAVGNDQSRDHNEYRVGANAKVKINKDWLVGGMLGWQADARNNAPTTATSTGIHENTGLFGSVYTNGKIGPVGLVGEIAVTAANLNGFNSWREDSNATTTDSIGSNNTGWGGYVFPNYTIDKLNLGLNIGGTFDGFLPDRAFGFVMVGSTDNSVITAQQIGLGGDYFWAGFVPSYAFSDSLKLTGNLVYFNVSNNWTNTGDGPGYLKANNTISLDSAWELSAVLQYTISKGANVFFSVGYLDPSLQYDNYNARTAAPLKDDAVWAGCTRFELAF